MQTEKRNRILVWLVIILFAMNLATIGSLLYHTRSSHPAETGVSEATVSGEEQGARWFRDQLDLGPEQMVRFREATREYNRNSHRLARDLEALRLEMVTLMTSATPDSALLHHISREIGRKHEELKNLTVGYYLSMRENCTPEQKEKLDGIFLKMVQTEEPAPAERGRRRGRGWENAPKSTEK